ncbi:transposase [Streptomyces morookaense]|uniref:transposase n=1 Tax=Streptomyces morookaense TaxID=1970 RepID=UPI0033C17CB8
MIREHVTTMGNRYSWLAPASLWDLAAPLIPAPARRPQGGGTARIDDESVFAAIAYVTVTDSPWRELPPVFGVSWQTAHRRFRQWAEAGLWRELHELVAARGTDTAERMWTEKLHITSKTTRNSELRIPAPRSTVHHRRQGNK